MIKRMTFTFLHTLRNIESIEILRKVLDSQFVQKRIS